MDIIIFSKDRAMQLDLCLRSIQDHVKVQNKVTVLWDYSDSLSSYNYYTLRTEYSHVDWILQDKLYQTLPKTIKCLKSDYIVLMVDDSIWVNDFDEEEYGHGISVLKFFKYFKCGSLMLHSKCNWNYAHNEPQIVPQRYAWNWTQCDPKSDWGYPHQIGGNIWKKDYLLKILKWRRYKNPTELESKLNFPYWRRRKSTPLMFCYGEQKILTIPINYIPKKQKENRNSGQYSIQELNEKFKEGYRFEMPKTRGENAICKEIPLKLRKN